MEYSTWTLTAPPHEYIVIHQLHSRQLYYYIYYTTPRNFFFLSSLLSPDPFVLMVFHLFLLFPYSRRVRPAERGGELCFPRFLTFHSLFLPIEKYTHTHTHKWWTRMQNSLNDMILPCVCVWSVARQTTKVHQKLALNRRAPIFLTLPKW